MRLRKQKKGFTLVEVIISIAALGIICAVLLRLFVLSSNTNDAAKNAQKAELFATSVIESISCADTIEDGFHSLNLKFESRKAEYIIAEHELTAVIEVSKAGKYPGTLYDISVVVQNAEKQLADISTKKYVKRSANEEGL